MARTVLNQVVADFNDDTDDSPPTPPTPVVAQEAVAKTSVIPEPAPVDKPKQEKPAKKQPPSPPPAEVESAPMQDAATDDMIETVIASINALEKAVLDMVTRHQSEIESLKAKNEKFEAFYRAAVTALNDIENTTEKDNSK